VCNTDDVIKTKVQSVWYFAYWRARDVPSGAEVAIVGSARASVRQCEHCRIAALALTELRKIKLKFRLDGTVATAL